MRSKSLAIALFLFLIAGPAWADCEMEAAAVLPLLSSGRPIIEVRVNNFPVRMMVDTGAQTSLVTPETAAMLDLEKDYDRGRTKSLGAAGRSLPIT